MGWCNATYIFDAIAGALLDDAPVNKKQVLKLVIDALEEGDWDCQGDSEYFTHPLVQDIFKELHPNWFDK